MRETLDELELDFFEDRVDEDMMPDLIVGVVGSKQEFFLIWCVSLEARYR